MRIYFTSIWILYHTSDLLDSLGRSFIVENHWFWVSSDHNLRGKCKYYLADHMIDILSGLVSAWWLASLWLPLSCWHLWPRSLVRWHRMMETRAGAGAGARPGHQSGESARVTQEELRRCGVSTRQRWTSTWIEGVWRLPRTLLPFGYISMLNWFDQTFNLGHTFVFKVDRG